MVQGELTITYCVHIYRHEDEEMNLFQSALEEIDLEVMEVKVHQEATRDFLVYNNLLTEVGNDSAVLLVKSLESICPGKEYIPAALRKLLETRVVLLVLDYPVMMTKLDLETNHLFLQLLMEVYSKPKNKLLELRAEKSKRLGRRKIRYPENWPDLYEKWQVGEITARDFMKATGIKRGTFYHMAAEYKEYLRSGNSEQELSTEH